MNHQCYRKGENQFQQVQNTRITRLAAAQVECTDRGWPVPEISGTVHVQSGVPSPPEGGQSSFGDTVTHFSGALWKTVPYN